MMKKFLFVLLVLSASCSPSEPATAEMSATVIVRNTDRVRVSCVYSEATVSFHEADAASRYENDPFTLFWDENQDDVRIEVSPNTPSPCILMFFPTGYQEPEPAR